MRPTVIEGLNRIQIFFYYYYFVILKVFFQYIFLCFCVFI